MIFDLDPFDQVTLLKIVLSASWLGLTGCVTEFYRNVLDSRRVSLAFLIHWTWWREFIYLSLYFEREKKNAGSTSSQGRAVDRWRHAPMNRRFAGQHGHDFCCCCFSFLHSCSVLFPQRISTFSSIHSSLDSAGLGSIPLIELYCILLCFTEFWKEGGRGLGIDAFHRREQVFDHSICSFSRCWGVFLLANLCLAGKSICCFIVTLTRRSNQKLLPKAEEMQTGWLLVQFARTVRRRLSKEERRKRSIPVEVGEKNTKRKEQETTKAESTSAPILHGEWIAIEMASTIKGPWGSLHPDRWHLSPRARRPSRFRPVFFFVKNRDVSADGSARLDVELRCVMARLASAFQVGQA